MNELLKKYLDGEVGLDELDPRDRAEAEVWGRLFADLRSASSPSAPGTLARNVMAAIEGEAPGTAGLGGSAPDHARAGDAGDVGPGGQASWSRALGWLVKPIRVPVPPAVALAAAALLAVLVWPSGGPSPVRTGATVVHPASLTTAPTSSARVYVELSFKAKDASSVAVAGDFTNWKPDVALQDPDGDGVWTALVPVSPGVHQYMFVVDGDRWVTDPDASRYVDDGFGHRNAVLAIAQPTGT